MQFTVLAEGESAGPSQQVQDGEGDNLKANEKPWFSLHMLQVHLGKKPLLPCHLSIRLPAPACSL